MQNQDKVFFLIFQTPSKNKFIHTACIRDYTVNLKLYLSDYLPIMEIESGYQSNVITLAMYQALYQVLGTLLPTIVPGDFSNIFVRLSVLVFHYYHNKLPKTWWLKITQIYYLNRVLDVRSITYKDPSDYIGLEKSPYLLFRVSSSKMTLK